MTEGMFTAASGQAYIELNILVNGASPEVVNASVYLGSAQARDGSIKYEILQCTQKASDAF